MTWDVTKKKYIIICSKNFRLEDIESKSFAELGRCKYVSNGDVIDTFKWISV